MGNCKTCGQKCAIKYYGCSNWTPICNTKMVELQNIEMSDTNDVLDKIRAEIERERSFQRAIDEYDIAKGLRRALEILNKYRESEE